MEQRDSGGGGARCCWCWCCCCCSSLLSLRMLRIEAKVIDAKSDRKYVGAALPPLAKSDRRCYRKYVSRFFFTCQVVRLASNAILPRHVSTRGSAGFTCHRPSCFIAPLSPKARLRYAPSTRIYCKLSYALTDLIIDTLNASGAMLGNK